MSNYLQHIKADVLLFMLFICEYQKIVNIDYGDDICILLIFCYILRKIYKKKKINKLLSLFFIYMAINLPIAIYCSGLKSYAIYFKIIILLIFSSCCRMKEDEKDRMLFGIEAISIPNILCGVLQLIQSYIFGIHLAGKHEPGIGFRLSGFLGHPIHFSVFLLGLMVVILFNEKSKYKLCKLALLELLIVFSWSSYSIVVSLLIIFYWIITRWKVLYTIRNLVNRHIKITLAYMIILISVMLFVYMTKEPTQIRYVSAVGVLKYTNIFSIVLGHGFGAFTKMQYAESYLFNVLFDTGIIGLLLLCYISFCNIRIKHKKIPIIEALLIGIALTNMVINDGYMIPFLFLIPLCCSYETI